MDQIVVRMADSPPDAPLKRRFEIDGDLWCAPERQLLGSGIGAGSPAFAGGPGIHVPPASAPERSFLCNRYDGRAWRGGENVIGPGSRLPSSQRCYGRQVRHEKRPERRHDRSPPMRSTTRGRKQLKSVAAIITANTKSLGPFRFRSSNHRITIRVGSRRERWYHEGSFDPLIGTEPLRGPAGRKILATRSPPYWGSCAIRQREQCCRILADTARRWSSDAGAKTSQDQS